MIIEFNFYSRLLISFPHLFHYKQTRIYGLAVQKFPGIDIEWRNPLPVLDRSSFTPCFLVLGPDRLLHGRDKFERQNYKLTLRVGVYLVLDGEVEFKFKNKHGCS